MAIRLTTEQFIEKANGKHINKYDYSYVRYINTHAKIIIICKEHGQFQQKPSNHLTGQGCPKCGDTRNTLSEFIEKANIVHNNKYDYSSVNYIMVHNKVDIICKVHNIFSQTPNSHLAGQGCPKCYDDTLRTSVLEFIEKANVVHNSKYDYSKSSYTTTHAKLEILCNNHGSFFQAPVKHLTGIGCPKCKSNVSKLETAWLDYHNVPDTTHNRQVSLSINTTKYKVDGFIPETNTVYEFWGDFWHRHPTRYVSTSINPINHTTFGELYKNTQRKRQKILSAGYNLVEIWESDWKNS